LDHQNSTPPKIEPRLRSGWTLGITVALLYAIFVTAVFAGFASYIYRTEWTASLASNPGGPQTVEDVLFAIRVAETVRTSLAAAQKDIEIAQLDVADGTRRVQLEEEELRLAPAQLAGIMDELTQISDGLGSARPPIPVLDGEFDRAIIQTERFAETLYDAIEDTLDGTELEQVVARLNIQTDFLSRLRRAQVGIDLARTDLAQLETALVAAQARAQSISDQLEEISRQAAVHATAQARLDALGGAAPPFGPLFVALVKFPTIFLTLIVTIAAGGLGTVVSYTRSSRRGEGFQRSVSRLFVGVGEGIAAAIGVFLFSGAGMLALTQGGGGGTGVELSPYTVAFVAFLSGFMAEDAFAAIQAAGKRLFKQAEHSAVVHETDAQDNGGNAETHQRG